mmetsp:Transcript_26077/g.50859  ORF Transcript_26077/g.50859 Transcript_26077/m.50859 type:complete len:217 (+) Transcript_26077:111-761(+)
MGVDNTPSAPPAPTGTAANPVMAQPVPADGGQAAYLAQFPGQQGMAMQQPVQPMMYGVVVQKPFTFPNEWSSGLCNCCQLGACYCLKAFFCGCCVFGDETELLVDQEVEFLGSCRSMACWVHCAAESCHGCIGSPIPLGFIFTYQARRSIRNRYGIREAPCPDLCVSCCCAPCAMIQEMAELRKHNAGPNGLNAPNVLVNGQLLVSAPTTTNGMRQ